MMEPPVFFDRSFVSPQTYDAFFSIVQRLETTIDAETALLTAGRHDAIADTTRQKRQGFLELNRVMQSMEKCIPSQEIMSRLASFQKKVETNGAALKVHLDASKNVTDIIMRVMRDSESDGTYSKAYGRSAYDDA